MLPFSTDKRRELDGRNFATTIPHKNCNKTGGFSVSFWNDLIQTQPIWVIYVRYPRVWLRSEARHGPCQIDPEKRIEGAAYEQPKSVAAPHDRGGGVCRPCGRGRCFMDEK